MKKKLFILITLIFTFGLIFIGMNIGKGNKNFDISVDAETNGMISVLVDGVEQSAFPSKGAAEYQGTSCTNGETAEWDATNWKLSIKDVSASTRCVVSFITGGHNVFVTASGGTVDSSPKNVAHNGNVTFTVSPSNANYVFTSAKCSGVGSYSWANNILSIKGVQSDAQCEVVFGRPTYTIYFNVIGGYTADNYLNVVKGGGNSTTFGAVPGFLVSGSKVTCDSGITGKITGDRIVVSNVQASGDCEIECAKDSSNYLPGGGIYNAGDEVSYANLAWLVVSSDAEKVTLILKGNATYASTSSSNLTGTGIFGSGVTYTSSSARSYLVDIWLEQDAQKYLRNAINSEGLEYQNDANGFIRLPYASEASKSIPNASNTNFWTMDNDGNGHVYYGQPNGQGSEGYNSTTGMYYYDWYALATNTSVSWSGDWTSSLSNSISGNWATTCGSSGASTNWNASTASNYYYYYSGYYGTYTNYQTRRGYYCSSTGATYVPYNAMTVTSNSNWYTSAFAWACGGTDWRHCNNSWSWCYNNNYADNSYSSGMGCASTCSTRSETVTCTATLTAGTDTSAGSGTQTNNAYSAAYKIVTQGTNFGSEVTSSTQMTRTTTFSYPTAVNAIGAYNNGVTPGVQAVSPTSSSAYTNETITTSNNNIPRTGSCYPSPAYYQGYGTSCSQIQYSISGTSVTPATNKTYVRYTKHTNTSAMGYRPVIVVYKAN